MRPDIESHLYPNAYKLLLFNDQEPGDILMLTAAVRALHESNPGRFRTAIRTRFPELWENNPFVESEEQLGTPDRTIECGYPLIQFANTRPYHFIHGFAQHLQWRLGVSIEIKHNAGDIHLSNDELSGPSPMQSLIGDDLPYWIIMAGGKYDFTAKWWAPAHYQAVVDHFRGRIQFVQCGAMGHWHPPLTGVTNLVGKTPLRLFIRLMHRASGVVCPVTFAMHLAAALPPAPGTLVRGCVVIAGGREPVQWELYNGHQFLHTIGALDCCARGGCWKSRCQPVGDGDPADDDLCVHPTFVSPSLAIPRCMDMIRPEQAIRAIELYYQGGSLSHERARNIANRSRTLPIVE